MKRAGLFGSNISYSLSPAIHQAAYRELGLDWIYELLDVPEAGFLTQFEQIRSDSDSWVGVNITIPFKQTVTRFLDKLCPSAAVSGVVNTVVRRGSLLAGENTDGAGFYQALTNLGWPAASRICLLFGAGGAARAAALALLEHGWSVRMVCRSPEKTTRFLAALAPVLRKRLAVSSWNLKEIKVASLNTALIINATPLGSRHYPQLNPWPEGLPLPVNACFYDLTYNPAATPFLNHAARNGLPVCNGLGMLVEQAALAIELWSGQSADREVMFRAAQITMEDIHAALPDSR